MSHRPSAVPETRPSSESNAPRTSSTSFSSISSWSESVLDVLSHLEKTILHGILTHSALKSPERESISSEIKQFRTNFASLLRSLMGHVRDFVEYERKMITDEWSHRNKSDLDQVGSKLKEIESQNVEYEAQLSFERSQRTLLQEKVNSLEREIGELRAQLRRESSNSSHVATPVVAEKEAIKSSEISTSDTKVVPSVPSSMVIQGYSDAVVVPSGPESTVSSNRIEHTGTSTNSQTVAMSQAALPSSKNSDEEKNRSSRSDVVNSSPDAPSRGRVRSGSLLAAAGATAMLSSANHVSPRSRPAFPLVPPSASTSANSVLDHENSSQREQADSTSRSFADQISSGVNQPTRYVPKRRKSSASISPRDVHFENHASGVHPSHQSNLPNQGIVSSTPSSDVASTPVVPLLDMRRVHGQHELSQRGDSSQAPSTTSNAIPESEHTEVQRAPPRSVALAIHAHESNQRSESPDRAAIRARLRERISSRIAARQDGSSDS